MLCDETLSLFQSQWEAVKYILFIIQALIHRAKFINRSDIVLKGLADRGRSELNA